MRHFSDPLNEPLDRPRVLLLDDDPTAHRIVGEMLRSSDLVSTRTVAEAVAALDGGIDLALVDIRLDDESGWDFVRHMREVRDYRHIPVVMLTQSNAPADRQEALRVGADRYLVKPANAETLGRIVAELLGSRDDTWWSLSLAVDASSRLRDLLFDPSTDLPTLGHVVQRLRARLESGENLRVHCIEIEPLFRTGERYSWEAFDQVRCEFVRGLQVVGTRLLGDDAILATSHAGAQEFFCFTAGNATEIPLHEVEVVARDLIAAATKGSGMDDEIAVFVGSAVTSPEPLYAPRILYNTVREAKDIAERRENSFYRHVSGRLNTAIRQKELRVVFQPILDLRGMVVVGYEALTRGPAGSEIESPEVIFELARDLSLVWELENLCIEMIRPHLAEVCDRGTLFFNLEAHFIQQLHSRGIEALEPLLDCCGSVVIEVTERGAIRDYDLFRRTLRDIHRLGFKIALDDCGSGYATLEAVAELKPDYLKVGHSLLRGFEHDAVRRSVVELVARCADSIGATTIAEAIETSEQLRLCQELGIALGQGYLFARPAPWSELVGLSFAHAARH